MTKVISEQFKEVSFGAVKNATDAVLFILAFGIGLGVSGRAMRGVHQTAQWAEGINVDSVR